MEDNEAHIKPSDLAMEVEEQPNGALEVWISKESDRRLFEEIAALLASQFAGRWTAKADSADQRSWNLAVDDVTVTLHLEHFAGISLFPSKENTDMEKANQLVLSMARLLQDRVD
jgi:hypothetical protein